MAKKGIFIAEDMASTKLGTLLRSATQGTEIENGSVVVLDKLVEGENDLLVAEKVAANTDKIYFVDGVEVIASEEITYGLDDFENLPNVPFRARRPHPEDRFSISKSMITGTPKKGEFVETPATGNKLKAVVTATEGASFVAKVVDEWTFGRRAIEMVRLQVINA